MLSYVDSSKNPNLYTPHRKKLQTKISKFSRLKNNFVFYDFFYVSCIFYRNAKKDKTGEKNDQKTATLWQDVSGIINYTHKGK